MLSSLKYTDEIRDEFQRFFNNPGSQVASCGVRLSLFEFIYDMKFLCSFFNETKAPYKPDGINQLKKPFYTPKEYLPEPISECKEKS